MKLRKCQKDCLRNNWTLLLSKLFLSGVNGQPPHVGGKFWALLIMMFAHLSTNAQLELVPLVSNNQITKAHQKIEQETVGLDNGLRNNFRSLQLFMPRNAQQTFCLDSFLRTEFPFDRLVDLECEIRDHSNFTIDGNCIRVSTFNISGIVTDRYCIDICDVENNCITLVITLEIRAPLNLPFFDDFGYAGPFPDRRNWLDRNVFVNNTMAKAPPSIGVATFDGLDAGGTPYGGEGGVSDLLTSTYIDLSGFTIQDNVYLSFFLQPKGLGLRPRASDVFRLEFRNAEGQWVLITEYPGISGSFPSDDSPPFEYRTILLTNAYLHDQFQFRFSNVGSRSGIREVWHLDYVRLDRGRTTSRFFEDIAFSAEPPSLLFPYTSMPAKHFIGKEDVYLNKAVEISMFSHFNDRRLADPSWHLLREELSGTNILNTGDLTLLELPPLVPANQRDLNPGFHYFVNPLRSDLWLNRLRQTTPGKDSLRYTTTFTFNQNQETINNIPITLRNNTVTRSTELKDYFAYDDGTAEMGIALISNPSVLTQLAIKYTAEVWDSIQGFQVHFPYVEGDQSNLLFNFKIWIGELKQQEDYRLIFQRPIYPDRFSDTLQAFTTYALINESTGKKQAFQIPPGDFYIGIQQVSIGARIPMGYDRNNPQGLDAIYFNRGQGWEKFADQSNALAGAVMLRPIMGGEPLPVTSVQEIDTALPALGAYPNPTQGTLHFKEEGIDSQQFERIDIVNTLGQRVLSVNYQSTLTLPSLPSGMYYIRALNHQGTVLAQQSIYYQK